LLAGISAKRMGLDALLVEKNRLGGSLWHKPTVEDHPVQSFDLTGQKMASMTTAAARMLNLLIIKETVVSTVKSFDGAFEVKTGQREYRSDYVIAATGRAPAWEKVEGEEELLGRGIFYFNDEIEPSTIGKIILVIGEDENAADRALLAAKMAKKVYFVSPRPKSELCRSDLERLSKAGVETICAHSRKRFIKTNNGVAALFSGSDGSEISFEADSVLLYGKTRPNDDFLPPEARGENASDLYGATKIPGLYLIGDMRRDRGWSAPACVGDAIAAVKLIYADKMKRS